MSNDLFNVPDKRAESKEARDTEIRNIRNDYMNVFGSPAGLRVFFDLLDKTFVFAPFQVQNANAYAKEGKRELGLYLLSCIGFTNDPASLSKLAVMLQSKLKKKEI